MSKEKEIIDIARQFIDDEIEALEREAMEAESYMDAPPKQQEMPDDLFGEQDEPRKRPMESGDGGYQQQQPPIQAAADDFLFGDAPLPVPQAEAAPAKRARLETEGAAQLMELRTEEDVLSSVAAEPAASARRPRLRVRRRTPRQIGRPTGRIGRRA